MVALLADARQRLGGRIGEFHRKTAGAQFAPELLAKQIGDVGFVIDHQNQHAHWRPPCRPSPAKPIVAGARPAATITSPLRRKTMAAAGGMAQLPRTQPSAMIARAARNQAGPSRRPGRKERA